MEQFVVGFGLLSDSDFSIVELAGNEEDSKESEEEKENEVEEGSPIQRFKFSFVAFELIWTQPDYVVMSLVREIPSPPPDSFS